MKKLLCITLTLFWATIANFAQEAKTSPTPEPEAGDVIRISSKLVLVDTIVLDKKGRPVTDLNADEFEIYQDGKPQKITNFAFVNSPKNSVSNAPPLKSKADRKTVPLPPVSVRSEQGRIITFVVDDKGMAEVGVGNARGEMKKFINEQMLPDDKVAIYRTRRGSNLLQTYTSNKEVLKRVIDKIWWMPLDFAGIEVAGADETTAALLAGGTTSPQISDRSQGRIKNNVASEEYNRLRQSIFSLDFVINRLKNLPGRKTLFYISDGVPSGFGTDFADDLKRVADQAARASVVIYTLNSRGVTVPGMIQAADDVQTETQRASLTEGRIQNEWEFRAGMQFLADATGGKSIFNRNFFSTEIEKILEAENGYYLIGYQPDDETFEGKEFHKIEVKLKRSGLEAATGKGFFGRADIKTPTKSKSSESPLYQAIASPFNEKGIAVRLTTLVGNDAEQGDYIRALFHVKGEDLTFTDEADGAKKTVLDVVAVALDEQGRVVEEFNRTYPISVPPQGFQTVRQNGLDYSTDLPIKKSGFYSFRLAVRDSNSKRLGSAGDFVQIPDRKKGKFLVAGLYTTAVTSDNQPLFPKKRLVGGSFVPVFFNSIPSIRQYAAGSVLAYVYNVYHAKIEGTTKQPKITRQIRLYKNGKLLSDGEEKPVEIATQSNASRLQSYGFLRLDEKAEAGEYVLQLIVRDKTANKTASQWIDFEVVR